MEYLNFGIVVASAFSLGFIAGKARLKWEMRRREEEVLADYLPKTEDILKDYPTVSEPKEDTRGSSPFF